MANYMIESYEEEVLCGTHMRVEGSGWQEKVEARTPLAAVKKYLKQGDYDDGDDERVVVISVNGSHFRSYTAPEVRKIQSGR